ncbi:MAG: FHA domain-containing protein [Verrucomicrobia bacterium]|nr:FHA domain-containing protein [Verrucomicrobiota bacterium]
MSLFSRHHFLLEACPPQASLRDLGSMNGTHLNGKKCGGHEKGDTPEQGAQRQYPNVDLQHGDRSPSGNPPSRTTSPANSPIASTPSATPSTSSSTKPPCPSATACLG